MANAATPKSKITKTSTISRPKKVLGSPDHTQDSADPGQDPENANIYGSGTRKQKHERTPPYRNTYKEGCDYSLHYCMKAYKTGVLCGRTINNVYANFMSYCQMDYVNCMERYEVWQLVHMGECLTLERLKYYELILGILLEVGCQTPIKTITTTVVRRPGKGQKGPVNNLGPPPATTSKGHPYVKPTKNPKKKQRMTPKRMNFKEDCDYLAYYCLRSYKTGIVCGRFINRVFPIYQNFTNYCMLDYANCMERYEVWQVVHMGYCFTISATSEYTYYSPYDDGLLDQYYVAEE